MKQLLRHLEHICGEPEPENWLWNTRVVVVVLVAMIVALAIGIIGLALSWVTSGLSTHSRSEYSVCLYLCFQ